MTIAAAVPDLLDRSRFPAGTTFVTDPSEVGAASVVFVDLDRVADPHRFAALEMATVAFGAHVNTDDLAAAEAAGFDEVMPRSVFMRRLPSLLVRFSTPSDGGTVRE